MKAPRKAKRGWRGILESYELAGEVESDRRRPQPRSIARAKYRFLAVDRAEGPAEAVLSRGHQCQMGRHETLNFKPSDGFRRIRW
jgi:hypothetical protein